MRSVLSLVALVACVAVAMAGEGGYGADPAPPAPPEPAPYADPMEEAAAAMETLEADDAAAEVIADIPLPDGGEEIIEEVVEPDGTVDIIEKTVDAAGEVTSIQEEKIAPDGEVELIQEEIAPDGEATVQEEIVAPDGAVEEVIEAEVAPDGEILAAEEVPAEVPAAGGYSDVMPMEPEPIAEPMPEAGGYRRAALKGARKRVISWSDIKMRDMFLVLDPNCRDNNRMCRAWAAVARGTVHPTTGKVVQKGECFRNSFMMTREGCPLSCGVCTPSRRDWAVRRRLAMRKRARFLRLKAAKKNL